MADAVSGELTKKDHNTPSLEYCEDCFSKALEKLGLDIDVETVRYSGDVKTCDGIIISGGEVVVEGTKTLKNAHKTYVCPGEEKGYDYKEANGK